MDGEQVPSLFTLTAQTILDTLDKDSLAKLASLVPPKEPPVVYVDQDGSYYGSLKDITGDRRRDIKERFKRGILEAEVHQKEKRQLLNPRRKVRTWPLDPRYCVQDCNGKLCTEVLYQLYKESRRPDRIYRLVFCTNNPDLMRQWCLKYANVESDNSLVWGTNLTLCKNTLNDMVYCDIAKFCNDTA